MLLLRGGHIKPITSPDLTGDLLIGDNGKIAGIAPSIKAPEGCPAADITGMLLTPGLMDAHTHIGLHGEAVRWEGVDINETSSPLTPQLRGIDGFNPMDEALSLALGGGVTSAMTGPGSANVIGGTFLAVKLYGHCVDDMVMRSPAAMKAAFGENPKGCYGQNSRQTPVTRMAVVGILREALQKAVNYRDELRRWEEKPEGKRPYDMKCEALLPVINGEIPLKAHAHRADDILSAVRVAREFGIKLTLDHCTEGHLIADVLKRYDYPVLVGPSLGGKTKVELKEKTFATAGILEKAGLNVCIITDAPVIPLQYLPLCAGMAMKEGLSEEGAWKAITINPARVAGVDDRVGSLEEGKDADLAIFNGDPLRDIQCRTAAVFVNGRQVHGAPLIK